MMPSTDPYGKERLAPAVAEARNWTDLMRRLDLRPSGGQRRVLQEKVAGHGLDTSHFAKRSPWRKYPDAAIAEAAISSSSLREVALKLGATPATGTLSHIRRRIDAAGIDISHFPGANRAELDLPFTPEELKAAAADATSVRGVARALGVPDDSRSRATLSRMLRTQGVSTEHLSHRRGERVARRIHVGEQRVATDLGQDVDLQHRAERRHLVARHVGMPELAVGDL